MRQPLIILFFFLLSSCGNHERSALPTEPNPVPVTTATVVGRVLSLQTGQPVANAKVELTSSLNSVTEATSNAEGRYSLSGLESGFYSIRVAGEPAGNVRLALGANERDVFVSADSRCIVQYGTVRDARSGRLIAGAKVTIFGREAVTGADGRYSVDFGCNGFVQGSTILITASANGYESFSTMTRASFLCTCSFDILLEPR